MANLVSNNLVITGDVANELGRKFFEEGMAYWEPMPKYLLEDFLLNTAKTPKPLWSVWAYDIWGTKWDIYKDDRDLTVYGPECVEVTFNTANGSIEPFVTFLASTYPQLKFELFFREEFDEAFTRMVWKDGIIQ